MIESIDAAVMRAFRQSDSRPEHIRERRIMMTQRVSILAIAMILIAVLAGCAPAALETPAGKEAGLTAPLDSQEKSEAAAVIERHFEALGANDVDALVEMVTESRRSVYLDNLEQLKRWKGFEVESVMEGGRFIRPDELSGQYDGRGFRRIAVFHVIGRLPQPRPDDVLPEEFDVIVVKDSSGRWLVHDWGH